MRKWAVASGPVGNQLGNIRIAPRIWTDADAMTTVYLELTPTGLAHG
jgi:hypothetical protein